MHQQQPKVGEMTPWGVAQTIEPIVEGIVFVSTPSHGGLWLGPERVAALPAGYQPFTCPETRQWAEEDIDAPMVACFFGVPHANPVHCQRIADQMGEQTKANWEALKPPQPACGCPQRAYQKLGGGWVNFVCDLCVDDYPKQ